ncbi:hypothetical protein BE21_46915 [Sorangium cellulosum]|uniref:Uncharacterized protein n=1 Tax=Sorangium cellulosum TaxID=56 RepID=A0A150TI84_SORCE|nr:hypothetical protein BE21_46915 [Sorangium cellulosum]
MEEGSLLWSLLSDVGRALLATRESSAQLTHHERIMGFMIPAFYLRLHGNPAEGLGLIDEALFVLPDEDTLRVTRAMLLVDVDPQLGRAALLALQSGKGGRAIAASTPGARLMIWCMLELGAIDLSTRAFRDARWALVRVPIEALPALVRDREAREVIERAARWAQGNEEPPDLAPEVITNAYFRQRIQRISAADAGEPGEPGDPEAPAVPGDPAPAAPEASAVA